METYCVDDKNEDSQEKEQKEKNVMAKGTNLNDEFNFGKNIDF